MSVEWAGWTVAFGSLVLTGFLGWLAHRRELATIRYGVVYQRQFEVCKELYTWLSRLRDAVERYTDLSGQGKSEANYQKLVDTSEKFRRVLRQNDFVLPEELVSELNSFWVNFKKLLSDHDWNSFYKQASPKQTRDPLLKSFDDTRAKLRPVMRQMLRIQGFN